MRQDVAARALSNSPHPARSAGRPPRSPVPVVRRQRSPCCIWPVGATMCDDPVQPGLAVCSEHAKILHASAGHECRWPGCATYAAHRALCSYHDQVARGVIDSGRGR